MHKIILTILLLFTLPAVTAPRGFIHHHNRHQPSGFNLTQEANTIHGVKSVAQDGDYVLLKGTLVKQIDKQKFIFEDQNQDQIEVLLSPSILNPQLQRHYYIWGKVQKNLFSILINIDYLSNPLSD